MSPFCIDYLGRCYYCRVEIGILSILSATICHVTSLSRLVFLWRVSTTILDLLGIHKLEILSFLRLFLEAQ
jgi:hypothetical protein